MIKQTSSLSFTSASLLSLLSLSGAFYLLAGCLPIPDQSKIQKLQDANKSHQQLLEKELDSPPEEKTVEKTNVQKPIENEAQITMEVGDQEPDWANKAPDDCGKKFYCGFAFKGSKERSDCLNKNICREENETTARNDLRKSIETKIRSETTKYQYSERDDEGENTFQQFEQEIRERGAAIKLKNVRFRHFYLAPEKQLITLARMKIPQEEKRKEAADEKILPSDLPPLIFALAIDQESDDLNETELLDILQLRLVEILKNNAFEVLNSDKPHLLGKASIKELRDSSIELIKEKENSAVLTLSLKGNISLNSSSLYPGMTRMFMSFSAYRGQGEIIWKKTYEAKRLDVRNPGDLSNADRQANFRKTLNKGFNEIEKKGFLNDLKTSF